MSAYDEVELEARSLFCATEVNKGSGDPKSTLGILGQGARIDSLD